MKWRELLYAILQAALEAYMARKSQKALGQN